MNKHQERRLLAGQCGYAGQRRSLRRAVTARAGCDFDRAARCITIGPAQRVAGGEQDRSGKNNGAADHESAAPCREQHYFL